MNPAAVSARRGRHCLAPPVRCPGRRRRSGPCRGIYLSGRGATLSWPRPRGEEHYLDAVVAAAMPTVILRTSCKLYGHVGIIRRVEGQLELVLVPCWGDVLDAPHLLDVVHEHVLHSICERN